ncbi:hypothetical protein DFJ67_5597 [Asanoa ferruginea]|uniref:Uncharacterized protein n=1 Tax=Asanoa ferruginea TaxID=53367 RepID=A0A3D9ZQB2_9ACTN|nr:hypothetical protein [Asanoa ferruginea]REF99558.1 hypothetical protein DFJ67_5597 [Asanoa ferruginea]
MTAGRHQRQGITSMLDRVPAEPSDGQVDRRTRYGHVVLAATTVAATLAAAGYLVSIDQ